MTDPSRTLCLLVSVLSALALAASAAADEVSLTDGRTIYGEVRSRGGVVEIETKDGPVSVPRGEVQRIRTEAELRTELAGLAARCEPTSAFCCLHLAHVARDFALDAEMWSYLDRALAQNQIPASVRERLDQFLAALEPELLPARWRKASASVRAREILFQLRGDEPKAKREAAVRVLAGLEGAATELRTRARSGSLPEQRTVANAAIWAADSDEARRFVYRTAVLDDTAEVRGAAVSLARQGFATAGTEYLTPALLHDNPKVRMRAAEAMADLGDASASGLLVRAAPVAAVTGDYGGVRAHAAFLTQQSYIRDFDVEVAQASFIADPKVDALTYGSVIDVRIGAVTTTRVQIVEAFRRSIAKLEGADPGTDPATWERWLTARRNG